METTAFKRALGQCIVALRRERSLSQERLALDSSVDRTRMGEIERGEANPTIDTLDKIARVLGQTLGSLVRQAEELSRGEAQPPPPQLNPRYIDRTVPLPPGLSHDQLAAALNHTLSLLAQLGVNPVDDAIPWNVYSSAVAKRVIQALAEVSRLKRNTQAAHPPLLDPDVDMADAHAGLEVIATQHVGKGGESTAPRQGWFMVVAYQVVDGQTIIVQVEIALLGRWEWTTHARRSSRQPSQTAVTIASATQRLRENSVYLDPDYATTALRRSVETRRRARHG